MRGLADGLTLEAVAQHLGLGIYAVQSRFEKARRALGCCPHGTGEAVAIAYARGELPLPTRSTRPFELSLAEHTVIRPMAEGRPVQEIAARTHQPLAVARRRVRGLWERMGATNRAHAVTQAYALRLVPSDLMPRQHPSRPARRR
ncbi:hypothetical protein [Streptomyces uncialis]|uniref:hypothetical protein n=1 Tax=Streptomyces uncialis TaxID=1048205 RepID=UPI0037BA4FB9